jgi:hypothetical protein
MQCGVVVRCCSWKAPTSIRTALKLDSLNSLTWFECTDDLLSGLDRWRLWFLFFLFGPPVRSGSNNYGSYTLMLDASLVVTLRNTNNYHFSFYNYFVVMVDCHYVEF